MPSTLGESTKRTFDKLQSHKLAYELTAHEAIKKGQQVVINTDGEVQGAGAGEAAYKILGVAMTDAAADAYVTVITNGFYVVEAKSGAAMSAGPIELGAYSDGVVVAAVTGADDAAKSVKAVGFALNETAGAGERVRALMNR